MSERKLGLSPDRYIAQAEILRTFRIGRATLWRWRRDGRFPRPIRRIGRAARRPAEAWDIYGTKIRPGTGHEGTL